MSQDRYTQLIEGVAELVSDHVPEGASVLVASGGDEAMLRLGVRTAIDFPDRLEDRTASYPPPGLVAVAQLEMHRAHGAEFLLVPSPELWLLDEFPVFERHVRQRYEVLAEDDDLAVLFALRAPASESRNVWEGFRRAVAECERALDRDPAILDWRSGFDVREQFPSLAVFSPLLDSSTLPYLNDSVDIVVISASAGAKEAADAERVARLAVIAMPAGAAEGRAPGPVRVEWNGFMREGRGRPTVIVPTTGPADGIQPFLASLTDSVQEEQADIEVLELAADESLANALNAAGSAAAAEVLVFVLPLGCLLPGSLRPLYDALRAHPRAGAVGGKLLTFSGDLLHAGGHILERDMPRLSCVSEVDYVSPTLLATRREVFAEVGGFSSDHPTTLFVDYSLRLRERGYRVLCQPESTMVLPERIELGALTRAARVAADEPVAVRR